MCICHICMYIFHTYIFTFTYIHTVSPACGSRPLSSSKYCFTLLDYTTAYATPLLTLLAYCTRRTSSLPPYGSRPLSSSKYCFAFSRRRCSTSLWLYIYTYIHTYTHTDICIQTYVYTYLHTHTHTHTNTNTHTPKHTDISRPLSWYCFIPLVLNALPLTPHIYILSLSLSLTHTHT